MTLKRPRKHLILLPLLILLAVAGSWLLMRQRAVPVIRHVVLISLDTCRADHLGCYGYARPTTPHIDALAGRGWRFNHTVTPIPLTLPAHTSMLTGTIPPHHGKHENKDPYLDPAHVTLAALLKAEGFRTGAFVGAQILNGSFGLNRGFDTYGDQFEEEDQSERRAEDVNRAAFPWLEKQKNNSVFLFLHYYDPHDAYDPPEPFATTYKDHPYAGEIAYTDHCIGEMMAKLKSLGMYKSALIIVTGDHGEMLGEHGEAGHMYFIYQGAVKVPLVIKLPGSHKARTIDDIAGIIDIVPTVCELLGIEPPSGIQGQSLAPHIKTALLPPQDRQYYCESLYPTKYDANTLLGLIGKRWKYIQTTRPELYDLQQDPGEQTNLMAAEPHRARILQDRLAQILEQSVREEKGGEDTLLDTKALKHLHSLGYVSGGSVKEDFSFDQNKEDPKDVIAFHEAYRKAAHLLGREERVDVRALGEPLIRQRPRFFESYNVLVGVAMQQKDYESAIHYGKKALELEPDRFDIHQMLGFACVQSKRDEAAAGYFERALQLEPEDPAEAPAKRAQVHNQLGLLRARQNQFAPAMARFDTSLKLHPNQPDILNTWAQALLTCPDPALRDPSKAAKLARQACALTRSKQPVYLSTLAVAEATIGNLREALTASEKAFTLAKATGDQALIAKQQRQLSLIRKAWADSQR